MRHKEKAMRYIKTLGPAAVVAVALMAFVGAGTASATVLCKKPGEGTTTGTTCPTGQAYEAKAIFDAKVESMTEPVTLKIPFKTMDCFESTIKGSLTSAGGEKQAVSISAEVLALATCPCTLAVLSPGTYNIEWNSGTHSGTVTSSGVEITVECERLPKEWVHCVYKTENTDLGTLKGGEPAKLEINASLPRKFPLAPCGEMIWEGNYTVMAPTVLYVAGET
jgi:hypothetical protein